MNENNNNINEKKLISIDSPFTELFLLLKRYEDLSVYLPELDYTSDELQMIHQHTENATDILLQGLRGVAHLIGTTSLNDKNLEEVNNIGFFISAISNLTEALTDLKSDTDFMLRKRGVMNY